jgi:phosphoenolpyruvate-protein phosphotransferase (PTS system enzyme I)
VASVNLLDFQKERIIQGVAASPGIICGLPYLFFHKELEIPIYDVVPEKSEAEIERFEQALIKTRIQVHRVRSEVAERLSEDEAKIFDAHLLVLEDKALIEETIEEQKKHGYNIEYCFHYVAKRYIDAFDRIDDEYIKERVTDIRDVTKRVLHNLLGYVSGAPLHLSEPRVLVSKDISPSDTISLDRNLVLAILTDSGSRTSHAVIMARSLKVPAVVGLHNITEQVKKEDTVLVDGYEGIVIINPQEDTLYRYGQHKLQREKVSRIFESALPLRSETADGLTIGLLANIEGPQDLPYVVDSKLDGIGLFRTESLLLHKDKFPSEEEQFLVYKNVLSSQKDPVVIRTLDLGGDKNISPTSFLNPETNPFMGFRAIRFCLEHKTIFKEQLRAILRASVYGKAKLMYPMISGVTELIRANALLEEVKRELASQHIAFDAQMPVGCMIEIPSAFMVLDQLSQYAAFFSIGTNDLIQYSLAVDRSNDRIAHLYEPHNPAIIRILDKIIKDSRACKRELSFCGEMAGDPIYVPLLIGLGARALSLAPRHCSEIKYIIRSTTLKEAEAIAKAALEEQSPQVIFQILKDFYASKTDMDHKQ